MKKAGPTRQTREAKRRGREIRSRASEEEGKRPRRAGQRREKTKLQGETTAKNDDESRDRNGGSAKRRISGAVPARQGERGDE